MRQHLELHSPSQANFRLKISNNDNYKKISTKNQNKNDIVIRHCFKNSSIIFLR